MVVSVDDRRRYQRFTGVGASITGASAQLLSGLPEATRRKVLARVFSRASGIGVSVVRQPLGANDFSTGSASLDDVPAGTSDPTLAHFALARDVAHVLPLLRDARHIEPHLFVVASPWSAPAWMKSNGSLVGGTLRGEDYDTYARYLVRALQAYGAAGVPVDALTVQNEPSFSPPGYPGMTLTAHQQAGLINRFLAPRLASARLQPQVYALDDNFDRVADVQAMLADPATRGHVVGIAFHCYHGDISAMQQVHQQYPGLDLAVSECSGGSWAPGFAGALAYDVRTLLIQAIRDGASWIVKWNLALDPSGGPTNGGCTTCRGLVTIDPSRQSVSYNEEYYALGHVGKFVEPGATVVSSTTDQGSGVHTVAFRNPDGTHALLAVNSAPGTQPVNVTSSGHTYSYDLPAGAVATFTW